MVRFYSRLSRTEEKRNIRKAFLYLVLTIISIILLIVFGLPAIAKLAAFLSDLAGSNKPIELTDTTPPAPPQLEVPPEFTNRQRVDIKGQSESEISIIVYPNNKEEEILSDKNGLFTYSFALLDGENTISVLAKDSSGNTSQPSKQYSIIYDDDPPKVSVNSPSDGQAFYGTKQRQIVIEGSVEEADTLLINGRVVVIESDNSFIYSVSLQEGDNNFEIVAKDKAGNETIERLTLQYWR